MKLPMSVFPLITSVIDGKADIIQGWRLRPLMTHNGHYYLDRWEYVPDCKRTNRKSLCLVKYNLTNRFDVCKCTYSQRLICQTSKGDQCLLLMRWRAPLQGHRNVPIRDSDGPAASVVLAFAERLLLAINGH